MRGHLGIGPVDRRLVEACLDDRGLGVVGDDETGNPADRFQRPGMGADPIRQPLGPGRLGIGEVRGAEHGNEDPGLPDLPGQPVDDHRCPVAGVIDEQLFAAGMGLAHRDRELALPRPIEIAEAGIAVSVGVLLDVLVPQDRKCDVLALEFPVDHRPVRLDLAAMALLSPGVLVQPRFKIRVRHIIGQRPGQARGRKTLQRRAHRRWRQPHPPGDPVLGDPAITQTQNLAHMAHANSPRWHQSAPRPQPKSRHYAQPAEAPLIPSTRATSSRNHGRGLIGTLGDN